MALPPVKTMPMPENSSPVPSVARIGGIFSLAIRTPFRSPAAAPIKSASVKIGRTQTGLRSLPPFAIRRISSAMVMEVILATPTVERSMPLEIIQTITPSDMRPNSGNCANMVWKLTTE